MNPTSLKIHSLETMGTNDGPGIRLVVFLQGCNFRCLYCHNPDTWDLLSQDSQAITVNQILDRLENQRPYFKSGGGLTASGGEPTLQAPALIELFTQAQARGFHTALDTNGSIFSETVKKLYSVTDLVILDVKHIDDQHHRHVTGASNVNTLKNAEYRESTGQPMWLRYVMVPGLTDQPEYLEKWAEHFTNFKTVDRVEILPYHTLGVHKYGQMGLEYPLVGVEAPSQEEVRVVGAVFEKYFDQVCYNSGEDA